MKAAAALGPGARLVDIAGGGHAPFLAHLEQVEAALTPFLLAAHAA
jgi:pimeloyl-[acyl-carrier protein] methyl ester esterase